MNDYKTKIQKGLDLLREYFPEFYNSKTKIFQLTETDFPFSWKDPLKAADNVLKLLARHIGLHPDRIELMFYEVYPEDEVADPKSVYLRFNNDKKSTWQDYQSTMKRYCIHIDASVFEYADWVIAAIAHELCYLKLLEHHTIDIQDEKLVDIATVYFGFGKLTAVASLAHYKSEGNKKQKNLGSLSKDEWEFVAKSLK